MQQTAITTAIEFNVQPQEKIMKAARVFGFTLIGLGMLGAGSVLADDLPLPADPVQQREQMRGMSAEDRTAQREQTRDQMQERMRSMTPEEQKLMRDTRAEGRARVESSANEETRQRSRDGSGQGRGQGGGKGGGMGGGMGGGGRGRS
jgi:uncharacterized membrane protein YgcG